MRRLLHVLTALALWLPAFVLAGPRPFTTDSLDEIVAARAGQPFLLALWSVECAPCQQELEHIGRLQAEFPERGLVLVSTDGAAHAEEADAILARHGLGQAESWIFDGQFPERLRYRIDPGWYGELPRSYFYDAGHQRIGKSGALSPELLRQWLAATGAVRGDAKKGSEPFSKSHHEAIKSEQRKGL